MCPKNGGQYIFFLYCNVVWGIHGIFTEYSQGIHMYRLCIGYVSVMYRLCVGTDSERCEKTQ